MASINCINALEWRNMIYRIDELFENEINPITGHKYDSSWIIFMHTNSKDYQWMCASNNRCAYTIKISLLNCKDWKMATCDFMGFCEANNKNAILVAAETDLKAAKKYYGTHRYNDSFLRENEPSVLVHSTPKSSWERIKQDGMLKSWNILKAEKAVAEKKPIGIKLGDPVDFSDYIMFGSGVTGEIVVNSKQQGKIIMDENAEYITGARLYFDAKKIAQDGLLLRDGCHLKVKDQLPLEPYLLWAATWDVIGLTSPVSTPKIFAEQADRQFKIITNNNLKTTIL